MLSPSYYLCEDVVSLSKDLLGKFLFTEMQKGVVTGGMIIETEAYQGPEDRASHAYNNRRTLRTEVMFHQGGICYVYLCYGIHYLLNVVSNVEGVPHAILIRGILPTKGIDIMMNRRSKKNVDKTLTNGPGAVAQALGINKSHNGLSLQGPTIWIEDRGLSVSNKISATARIGVDYAGDDALLPWRFCLNLPEDFLKI